MKGVHMVGGFPSTFPEFTCPFCDHTLDLLDLITDETWGSGKLCGHKRRFWLEWEVTCPHCKEEFGLTLLGDADMLETCKPSDDDYPRYHTYYMR